MKLDLAYSRVKGPNNYPSGVKRLIIYVRMYRNARYLAH